MRIRFQHFRSMRIRTQIRHTDDQNCKVLQLKKNKNFIAKNFNFLFLGWRTSKLQEKPSALKENIQHFETQNFFIFSTFVGHFCSPGSGTESSQPSSMRIRVDPDLVSDPQHCLKLCQCVSFRVKCNFVVCTNHVCPHSSNYLTNMGG